MIRVILVFFILMAVYGQIDNGKNVTEIKKFLDSYRDKICKSEKTCHLVDKVPESFRTLRERNCMCDWDCTTYEDCCEDSVYFNKYEERHSLPFHCSTTERIYMKTSCPPDYPNRSVQSKCESSTGPLRSDNRKLFIPVTNIHKNITYGNEYCAICNNDYSYQVWTLTSHCSIVYDPSPPSTEASSVYSHNFDSTSERLHNRSDAPTTEFVDHYLLDLEEAKKRIRFDPLNKTFFSEYNGKLYECWYRREIPHALVPHFRDCVPVISNCTNNDELSLELCQSYTSIVFDEYKVAYKNKDCAYCNGVSTNLTGCANPPDTRITGSSLFTTFDKGSGHKPPCGNAKLKDKFCK